MEDRFPKIRLNNKILKKIMDSAAAFNSERKSRVKLSKKGAERYPPSKSSTNENQTKAHKISKGIKKRGKRVKFTARKHLNQAKDVKARVYGRQSSTKAPQQSSSRRTELINSLINNIKTTMDKKSLISEINEKFFQVKSGESSIFFFEILTVYLKDSLAMEVFYGEIGQLRDKFRRLEDLLTS